MRFGNGTKRWSKDFLEAGKEPKKTFLIGADGWKIVRFVNHDEGNTAAKACELIRDMLAGRSYRLPYWDVSGEVVIPE